LAVAASQKSLFRNSTLELPIEPQLSIKIGRDRPLSRYEE